MQHMGKQEPQGNSSPQGGLINKIANEIALLAFALVAVLLKAVNLFLSNKFTKKPDKTKIEVTLRSYLQHLKVLTGANRVSLGLFVKDKTPQTLKIIYSVQDSFLVSQEGQEYPVDSITEELAALVLSKYYSTNLQDVKSQCALYLDRVSAKTVLLIRIETILENYGILALFFNDEREFTSTKLMNPIEDIAEKIALTVSLS